MKIVLISFGVQSHQGQWVAENMHSSRLLLGFCSVIDLSLAFNLSIDETTRIQHRSGDRIDVQHIVIGHPNFVIAAKTCVDCAARIPPGTTKLMLIVDPDGSVADIVCEEVAARMQTAAIDIEGFENVPVFECRHKRIDRTPVEELPAMFEKVARWLEVPEFVED